MLNAAPLQQKRELFGQMLMENKVEAGVERVFVCVCGREMEIERSPAGHPAVLYSACTCTPSDPHSQLAVLPLSE